MKFKTLNRLRKVIERQSDHDNDGLDQAKEYFRKKKKGNDKGTYSPPKESEPPHY